LKKKATITTVIMKKKSTITTAMFGAISKYKRVNKAIWSEKL